MTEILQSPLHLPSSPSSIPCVHPPPRKIDNDGLHQQPHRTLINRHTSYTEAQYRGNTGEQEGEVGRSRERKRREREEGDQLSLLEVLATVVKKSLVACRSERIEELSSSGMEIGWPTNVRHIAHVTFDRFDGFLGLPVEFEPEVPRRPPSASTRVFGVSVDSMQLSFDSRGNSVPTILLMMQRRLYLQGGLQAEGIFRINGENGQEEYIREELNRGVIPDDIDVHCLAGLIKAWFRELPNGILDSLSPEQVMEAESEEACTRLVRLLPPTEAALLDWAINLMADVAQMEHFNKMNTRNIAMVFAPNMTQMSDPLTALMYAVQVMNFLKTLILMTLREREDSVVEPGPATKPDPSDENDRRSPSSSSQPVAKDQDEINGEHQTDGFLTSMENVDPTSGSIDSRGARSKNHRIRMGPPSSPNRRRGSKKSKERSAVRVVGNMEKGKEKESSIVSRLNSITERVEAWR